MCVIAHADERCVCFESSAVPIPVPPCVGDSTRVMDAAH